MSVSFRHSAGFGKRIEYWVVGLMLKAGLDVYLPLVDDDAIDAVIKLKDGSFIEVQIKARSNDVVMGSGAFFAALKHELRENYWFVFYSERLDTIWIMSSEEFIKESVKNITGKNVGKHAIGFNGIKTNRQTKEKFEYPKERYEKYICKDKDFSRFKNIGTNDNNFFSASIIQSSN